MLLYSDISNFTFWTVNILKCKIFLIGFLGELSNLKGKKLHFKMQNFFTFYSNGPIGLFSIRDENFLQPVNKSQFSKFVSSWWSFFIFGRYYLAINLSIFISWNFDEWRISQGLSFTSTSCPFWVYTVVLQLLQQLK